MAAGAQPSFLSDLEKIPGIQNDALKALTRPDEKLDKAIANSAAKGLPPIAISPMQGQHLALEAQFIGAKSILEVGTLGGVSTLWFARTGAHITSLELNPKHRDVALENVAEAGYADKVDVILGSALEILPKLVADGRKFDMVFIDADWPSQAVYFDWAVKLTRQGGCIHVDNVVQEMTRNGQAGLVAAVGNDDRVTAALIPTISAEKYTDVKAFIDGHLIARVN